MKKIIVFLVILFLFSPLGFCQSNILTAAANPWPPYIDSNNPTDGLSLEIIRAAYMTQGYTVTMDYVPWARAMKGVIEGEYDILPDAWYSDSRAESMLFSQPYAVNEVKFISTKAVSFEYNGKESLRGKSIGVIRGFSYNQDFADSKEFKKEEVGGFMQNILKLLNDRIDLTLEDEIVAKAAIILEDPDLLNKLHFSSNSLTSNKLYITCGLKNPRHREIINAFNKGYSEIKSDGTLAAILARYGM